MDKVSAEEEKELQKICEDSDQMTVDILKIVNGKSISAVTDALARAVSMTVCNAVLSNIIDISQREKLIDSIGNSAKLYLSPKEIVKNSSQH